MGDLNYRDLNTYQLGLEHYLLIGLVLSLIKGKHKSFLKNVVPFILAWMFYDLNRGLADNISPTIHIEEIYYLEKILFGWMFGGQIPAFWAQQHQYKFMLIIFAIFYLFHFAAPFLTAMVILYKSKDEDMFREYVLSFLLTSYAALLTFALYPVAPPWYVWNGGGELRFTQPIYRDGLSESAANLVNFDRYFEVNLFGNFYRTFNKNLFAAFPSLHGAYSFYVAYYIIRKYYPTKGKIAWLSILYPIGVWGGAVYLNHHYIVDLLGGMLYAYISIRIVRQIRNWRKLRNLDKSNLNDVDDTETGALTES